jgi:hypothetical protein
MKTDELRAMALAKPKGERGVLKDTRKQQIFVDSESWN